MVPTRIPYPATVSKYFAVVSEVVTMALLRSFGALGCLYLSTDTRVRRPTRQGPSTISSWNLYKATT